MLETTQILSGHNNSPNIYFVHLSSHKSKVIRVFIIKISVVTNGTLVDVFGKLVFENSKFKIVFQEDIYFECKYNVKLNL